MKLFTQLFACWSLLALCACTRATEPSEQFELREPGAHLSLELRSDGTAVFNRELKDASGASSKFRSTSGKWTKCVVDGAQKSEKVPALEETTCFIVEVVGTDEQGEARFGMNFVREGNSLTQLMESGPTFVLKKTDAAKRP
ncbi:MAG TPA: hypothetical protein VGO61_16470 [Steroidobacteraceae bacterium]|jgi:hypothetical protein|nr:hypothetical protein [Steroidobacteraceae bacterium]